MLRRKCVHCLFLMTTLRCHSKPTFWHSLLAFSFFRQCMKQCNKNNTMYTVTEYDWYFPCTSMCPLLWCLSVHQPSLAPVSATLFVIFPPSSALPLDAGLPPCIPPRCPDSHWPLASLSPARQKLATHDDRGSRLGGWLSCFKWCWLVMLNGDVGCGCWPVTVWQTHVAAGCTACLIVLHLYLNLNEHISNANDG